MKSQAAAVPLHMEDAERQAPSTLALVAHRTVDCQSAIEAEQFDFDDGDVIAGIVPVPSAIPPAMRDALERMMDLRFNGDTGRLDWWLHADHPALQGASPFETLVAGDGAAVLRALLWSVERPRPGRALVERFHTMLRLVR